MAFDGDFYRAIELTVEATGAQGVQQLEARVHALQAQLVAYQQALAAGAPINQKALDGLESLIAKMDEAGEAAAAANRVLNGLPAKMDGVGKGGQAAARGVLELSRGLEDLTTGGFLGILNNIPGTIGNFGTAAKLSATQVAVLTSAATGLGTVAYLIYQNWDRIKKLFDDGLGPKLIDDVRSVTAELKELTEKEWKTRVDVRDIDIAKGKLDELTKAKAAYDKLNVPDEATKDRGDAVVKAIVENQGPLGREGLTQAVISATGGGTESPQQKAAREKIESLKAQQAADVPGESPFDSQARRKLLGAQIKDLTESREGQAAADMINRRAAVEQMLGKAAGGDEMQLRSLIDIVARRPNKFAAQRIDPDALLGGLQQATPEAVAKSKKIDEDYEAAVAETDKSIRAVKDFFRDVRKQLTKDVSRVGPGANDQLQKNLFDAIRGGATPEAAMEGQRAGLVDTLRGRGVDEGIVGKVADKILEKASEAAQNLINEGGRPKLDVKADAAKKKATDERAKEIRDEATRVGPGFDEALEQAMLARVASGQGVGAASGPLTGQLGKRLAGWGVPEDIRDEVADAIMDKAREKVANRLATARDPQAAAGRAATDRAAKASGADHASETRQALGQIAGMVQAEYGTNDQQSAALSRRILDTMNSKGLGLQEATLNVMAEMAAGLQSYEARIARLQGQLNMIQGTMRRGVVRGPSLLTRGTLGIGAILVGLGADPAQAADVERAANSVAPAAKAMGQQAAATAGLARDRRRAGMQMRSFYPPFGG